MKELYINLHTTELKWVMVLNKYSITYNVIYTYTIIYSYLSIEPMPKIHFMHVPHVLPDAAIT